MQLGTSDSGKNGFALRKLLYFVPVVILIGLFALVLSSGSKPKAQRIVVLTTWSTNGEQLVTFRLEPPNSEVAWAELVPADDDGRTQPPTFRSSWGDLMPVSFGKSPNSTVRYDALPLRGASVGGRPLAYTPGSYTVAYTPTASANRLRAGLALERKGPEDWVRRCRRCWEEKSLLKLWLKTHQDPVFVVSEPITNVVAVVR